MLGVCMDTLFGSSGAVPPDGAAPAAVPAQDSLQFERAEPAGGGSDEPVICAACAKQIDGVFYVVNGAKHCRECKEQVEARPAIKRGVKAVARGALFGFGAALLGTLIYYAVLALSGYEIGWIAIIVGWVVGKAVHRGAYGMGGWKLQAVAVGLTYCSIVASYVPLVLKEAIAQQEKEQKKAAAQTGAVATPQPAAAASAGTAGSPASGSAGGALLGFLIGVAILFLFALAIPFLAGLSNILGLLIIFFGLFEAWKLNRAPQLQIAGPFETTAGQTV